MDGLLRALSGEHLEANAALGQQADGFDKMVQAAAQAVKLPHNQNIAIPQCLEAGLQT